MRMTNLLALLVCSAGIYAQQISVPRIEKMPLLPQPYEMRDWKEVAAGYTELVFDTRRTGDLLPLVSRRDAGINYPETSPLLMDTYVGWNAHGKGSEAINVMPAVVSAVLFSDDEAGKKELAAGIIDFFNKRNGENVYLNGFSARSGNDWWYDVMPNLYFYQLYSLCPQANENFPEQFISIADRWLGAVRQLGGNPFLWKVPDMNHRAFNLSTGKPLTTGVKEPESAGSIAWILYRAYTQTGNKEYFEGAQLAMEFLDHLTANPSYELQLPYGVQAAARMNAVEGTNYDLQKMFNWCFDRGPLRGWGCIVGNWGGYDVSGLIGEANDRKNDYAFIMNGFQQMAALAPVAKYDKRFARAFARWALNNANASRLFYRQALPEQNQQPESYAWSLQYDPEAVIPYESMKENWEGVSPRAMGDAFRSGWAKTDLSLYSGSSVGYLAAVVEQTQVEGILQLDLNRTDFYEPDALPTYLYYNPYEESKSVRISLPEGTYKIYDAISERFVSESVSGATELHVPADGVVLAVWVPQTAGIEQREGKLYAGEQVIDYHYGYDYTPRPYIKSLRMQNTEVKAGSVVSVFAHLGNAGENPDCQWWIDDVRLTDKAGTKIQIEVPSQLGIHTLKLVCSSESGQAVSSVSFLVKEAGDPSSVETESSQSPSFILEGGIVRPSVSGVEITGIYSLTGVELPNQYIESGMYVVRYQFNGRTYHSKACFTGKRR